MSKLSLQHKFTTEQQRAALRAVAGLVGIKVNDDPPALAGYNFRYNVGRRVFDAATMDSWNDRLKASPQAFADWWWGRVIGDIQTAPHALWEVVNEYGTQQDPAKFAQFEIACMKHAESVGVKLVIGNFSTGTPSDFNWWKGYMPALDYARAHRHSFGQHGYYGIKDKQPVRVEWNLDRLEIVRKTFPGIFDGIDVFLTECGVDIVEDIHTPGWKTCLNAEEYLGQLTGFVNDLLEARPYIKAAFIYQLGGGGDFDIQPILPGLCKFISASSGAPTPGPIIEVPAPTPAAHGIVTTTALNIRTSPHVTPDDNRVGQFRAQTPVEVLENRDGWSKIALWVKSDYLKRA